MREIYNYKVMLAIHFDSEHHLHVQRYSSPFYNGTKYVAGVFKEQQQDSDNYHILKSGTLTAAFLRKYHLLSLTYNLIGGYTIVLPGLRGFDFDELRKYRYEKQIKPLRLARLSGSLPDTRNSQPKNVLVHENNVVLSLKSWNLLQHSICLHRVIATLPKIHAAENAIYLAGTPGQYALGVWRQEFGLAGYAMEVTELDDNVYKITCTPQF